MAKRRSAKKSRKPARKPARSARRKPARKAPKRTARRPAKRAKPRAAKKPARRAKPRAKARPKPQAKPRRSAPRAASPSRRMAQSSMVTIERDRRALKIASVILGFFAFVHLLRFVIGFTLKVDGFVLPLNASGAIVIIFGVLALWYYRLSLD